MIRLTLRNPSALLMAHLSWLTWPSQQFTTTQSYDYLKLVNHQRSIFSNNSNIEITGLYISSFSSFHLSADALEGEHLVPLSAARVVVPSVQRITHPSIRTFAGNAGKAWKQETADQDLSEKMVRAARHQHTSSNSLEIIHPSQDSAG